MRVIIKMPEYHWFEADIPNNYDVFEGLIGGKFMRIAASYDVDVLCNDEEDLILDLPFNTYTYVGKQPVAIYGPIIFCSHEDEDFCSLSDEDVSAVIGMLDKAENEVCDESL